MTEELESLERIVNKLEEGQFSYLLTGSMAMVFYSIPRMTRDTDIVIQLFGKDKQRFIELLKEDFLIDENIVDESFQNFMMFNVFDKKSFFKIDFILKNNEEYENVKFERKKKLKINGLEVYVISIEDLIISKLNWAKDSLSEMQLNDIRELMKKGFDENYVNEWVLRLNLKKVFEKL